MHQCENLGFFHIRNIEGFNEDELLRDFKEFHALPDEIKHTLKQKVHNADNANRYRGFVPFLPNADSHKELLDMGCDYDTLTDDEKRQPLTEETPFPKEAEYAHIKAKFLRHYDFRLKLSLKLIEYIAIGLGKDRHFFKTWFEE